LSAAEPAELEPAPERPRIEPLYDQLPARGRRQSLAHDAVASNQRSRMIGAMIAETAERGYADATLSRLVALAGVSKRAFHEQFGSKEAYFLATYDAIVANAVKRVRLAYRSEGDWHSRLRAAFRAYVAEVVDEPQAAQLVLVEALAAGQVALARMGRTRLVFEEILRTGFGDAPDGVPLPPLIAKGIVSGVERVTVQRLLGGEAEELPALADDLFEWALSYRSVAAMALAAEPHARPAILAPCCRHRAVENEWARILRCAARISATSGYAQLTPARIVAEAGISEGRFNELFDSTEQCFLDAMDRLVLEALVCAARGVRNGGRGSAGVHCGIAALMRHIATSPVLVRIAFVESFAFGAAGAAHRERLMGQFTDHLLRVLPPSPASSRLVADASVGAVWGIIHHCVARGATRLLPCLADHVTYITLAPLLGADAARPAVPSSSQVN
jgi:AcrR family transcriptional regulator